jgi:uncharacterized protein (TIGR00645 family)
MEQFTDPNIWASFITLAALEIVLGIDNLVFVALLAGRLPENQQSGARRLGLTGALVARLALLWSIVWLVHLTEPVVSLAGYSFSWRDLILLGGGAFLLFKGTQEIHARVEGDDEAKREGRKRPGFASTLLQIILFDIIFSLDSVITAVGIAQDIRVMAAAIVVAMALMLAASGPLAAFIERHGSVKMLALSFLLLIGMVLVADGFGYHMPRAYIYAAMGFSVLVESLNLLTMRRRRKNREHINPTDMTPTMEAVISAPQHKSSHKSAERMIERLIFQSRWLLAPVYVGLVAGLLVVLIKFAQRSVDLVGNVFATSSDDTIVGILGLIDLALMGSLLVMVMFAGYENFVSKLDLATHADKPSWMGQVDFGDLKLKLMASIVAISAIHVLGSFMNVEHLTDRELAWSVGIHMSFVVSGVLLAVMDRLTGKAHG